MFQFVFILLIKTFKEFQTFQLNIIYNTIVCFGENHRKMQDTDDKNRELLAALAKREEALHQANVSY